MPVSPSNFIYGRHPVVDAIKNGISIDKIFLQKGISGDFEQEIRSLSLSADIPLQVVPRQKMNRITSGNHQGVIAQHALLAYQQLEDVLPMIYENSQQPLIVVLDGITDVRNFGAIARSAEVLGAHAIVVPSRHSAPINAEAVKTSAGALTRIPVCRVKKMSDAITELQMAGLNVVVSSLGAKKQLYELELNIPLAVVMGSEDRGVHPSIAKAADQQFIIPQRGQTDSLNVSVATGIILYEVLRQRK